jgi:hypothetical protein
MKLGFLFTLLFWGIISVAQVNIFNESLTDSSINIFYVGIENKIKLKITNYRTSNESLTISGGGGTLTKLGTDEYIVRVSSTGTCELFYSENKKIIFKKSFNVEIFDFEPLATVSGMRDTTIRTTRILINPFLTVIMPGCYLRHGFIVTSFNATFIQQGDSTVTFSAGNKLSEEQLKAIKELNSGDKIYFDKIRALGPDDRGNTLKPFWIKIL